MIPDYELPVENQLKRIKINYDDKEFRSKHPLEILAQAERKHLEYTNFLEKNQILIFNIPPSQTDKSLRDLCQVKGVNVMKVELFQGLDPKATLFAKITVANPQQAKNLRDSLYNKWIEDKLLKAKLSADLTYETLGNRTVVMNELPIHYRTKDLFEHMTMFGTIVGVELPMKDAEIEHHLKQKLDVYQEQRLMQNEKERRRAQLIIKESIMANQEYEQALTKYLGPNRAKEVLDGYQLIGDQYQPEKQLELMQDSKHFAIHSILTQLQSESSQVNEAKDIIQRLKTQMNAQDAPGLPSQNSQSLFQQATGEERATIRSTVNYLFNNRDLIDEKTLSQLNHLINNKQLDPLEQLEKLSKKELALAYDNLLLCLQQREYLIKQRIKDQTTHLGVKERILFEVKDWAREYEDVKDLSSPLNNRPKVENFLSISEQVQNVIEHKNSSPEEKLQMIIMKVFNPFEKTNFSRNQLAFMEAEELEHFRVQSKPDPRMPPSIARMNFSGAPLKPEAQKMLQQKIKELHRNFDLPFDELYHKEKKLVESVIKAEKALKEKELTLPNPYPPSNIVDPDQIPTGILEGTGFEKENQFQRDVKRQDFGQGSGNYDFMLNDENEVQKMIQQGIMTQSEYDQFIKMRNEANRVNLGYAFDEAKYALIAASEIRVEEGKIETFLKGKIDHGDMDKRWTLNRLKNDSKLVDEMEKLREAKKELRDFENNIDSELPSLKKLQQFRKMARDHIEKKPFDSRKNYQRTPQEEEKVNQMIRKLQKENPDIDYTSLFDSTKTEEIRKVQHKEAFAAYKAFQFLKHGVEFSNKKLKQEQEKKQDKLQPADPFNFPTIDETVAKFITKDKFPRVIRQGDALERSGRRFGYSEQEFLEAYFGKDFAKIPSLEVQPDNPVFGYNESLKVKYPIDKYKQLPVIQTYKEKLGEEYRPVIQEFPGNDDAMNQLVQNLDKDDFIESQIQDTPHPSKPGRTLLNDIEIRVQNYIDRRVKENPDLTTYNPRELQAIKLSLYEEYFPGYKPPARPKKTQRRQRHRHVKKPIETKVEDTKQTQKFELFYEGEIENEINETQDVLQESSQPNKHQTKQQRQQRSQTENIPEHFEGQTLDPELSDLNKDFIYRYEHNQNKFLEYNPKIHEQVRTQRLIRQAEENEIPPKELFDKLKDATNLQEATKLGGEFYEKERANLLKNESDLVNREKQAKFINDYARDSESEREEEDLYNHYLNQMKKAKDDKPVFDQSQLNQKLDDIQNMLQDTPRFEGYFKSVAEGKHPFEKEKYQTANKFNENLNDHQDQELEDQELFMRELKGRLMGEKLTPRQFGVLFNSRFDHDAKSIFERDEERKQFLSKRVIGQLMGEAFESFRRKKVIAGEWKEMESHQKLKETLKEIEDQIPNDRDLQKKVREMEDYMYELKITENPKRLLEKEYYFDEGLGESLQDHAEKIKKSYPELEVQIRRDRDGYAIVKTIYKPKYKYNLDEILKFNPKEGKEKLKENMNSILKAILPVDKAQNIDFSKIDKDQLQKWINLFLPYQQEGYEPDLSSKEMLAQLFKERFVGIYKDDNEGFIKELMEISENMTYDTSKKYQGSANPLSSSGIDFKGIIEEIEDDKDRMMKEFAQQLGQKVKEHLFFKERKPTDFVKGRRNEQSLFAKQVENYDRSAATIEEENEELLNDKGEQLFDKQAYLELKAEIKRRRNAKERLLQQGFPELKPYIHI